MLCESELDKFTAYYLSFVKLSYLYIVDLFLKIWKTLFNDFKFLMVL